jgi:hypothetical protein
LPSGIASPETENNGDGTELAVATVSKSTQSTIENFGNIFAIEENPDESRPSIPKSVSSV